MARWFPPLPRRTLRFVLWALCSLFVVGGLLYLDIALDNPIFRMLALLAIMPALGALSLFVRGGWERSLTEDAAWLDEEDPSGGPGRG